MAATVMALSSLSVGGDPDASHARKNGPDRAPSLLKRAECAHRPVWRKKLDVRRSEDLHQSVLPAINPATNRTTKMTIAMKNRMRAMSAEAAAMPPKPKIAATIEMTRNSRASLSMTSV